jgi:hypothetical protein
MVPVAQLLDVAEIVLKLYACLHSSFLAVVEALLAVGSVSPMADPPRRCRPCYVSASNCYMVFPDCTLSFVFGTVCTIYNS